MAREGSLHTFDQAALALNENWGTHSDGKRIQRWSEAMGRAVVRRREQEVRAYEQGCRPASPPNAPALRVIGMDGGRVQTRDKQGENGSRWREGKVCAVTSYLPGDGTPEHPPAPRVTTYAATIEKSEVFGRLVHVEAERRGMRQAAMVLVMGDGGNRIDPLGDRERLHDRRIVDDYHAVEHLHEAARAALGKDTREASALAEQLKDALWNGRLDDVISSLKTHAERLGPPQSGDGPEACRLGRGSSRASRCPERRWTRAWALAYAGVDLASAPRYAPGVGRSPWRPCQNSGTRALEM